MLLDHHLALQYLSAGLSLVPCSAETKRPDPSLLPRDENDKPVWGPYQEHPPTAEVVKGWFSRGCKSVAGIGGKVSGGLLVIDFDESRFYDAWRQQVGSLADGLPVQRTGRESGGYQVWLRCPIRAATTSWRTCPTKRKRKADELQSKREAKAAMPWSPVPFIHRAGDTRPWQETSPTFQPFPRPLLMRVLAAARKLDEAPFTRQQLEAKEKAASTSTKYRNESNGHGSIIDAYNERATIREALDRYGYTRMGERYVRPGGKSGSVTVRDGRSFHHSSNDALNDGYWHRPFDLYCQCEHGGEIKAAVKAAAEHLGLRHLPSSGQSMEEKTQPKTIDYHPLTCAQLIAARFEIRFLVESIMAAGQPLVVAAPQKALKTSTSLDMAFALATGGYFLGRFKVPEPVAVGFFSGESGLPTLAETLRRIARAAGHDPSGVRNLIVSDRVPQIGSLDHLASIDALILEHALEVLFIDPVFMAMDGADAGNLFIQGQLLRRVSELCQDRGCTLVLLHHVKKGSGNDYQPLELSAIAWAGFAEAARQWILLNRREPFEPGSGLHRLHVCVGGSAGHGGYWGLDVDEGRYQPGVDRLWNVTLLTADELRSTGQDRKASDRAVKRQETLETDRREVVNAAVKLAGPETKNGLRDRVGCGHRRFDVAFASLVDDGTLVTATVVKPNGQTYDGWRVCDVQEV